MTEREFTINRINPLVERLRQLGVTVPDPPESEGNEFSDCKCENGSKPSGDGKKIVCPDCFGSGQLVVNKLWDWQRQVMKLWQEHLRNGGS